jgi:hypothetical protein
LDNTAKEEEVALTQLVTESEAEANYLTLQQRRERGEEQPLSIASQCLHHQRKSVGTCKAVIWSSQRLNLLVLVNLQIAEKRGSGCRLYEEDTKLHAARPPDDHTATRQGA